MILLRRLMGGVLRRQRQRQGRTLREVSSAARVSLGYLSEVERGQKEPSSELLASICHALGMPMSSVLREVSDEIALAEAAAAQVPAQTLGTSPALPAALTAGTAPFEPVLPGSLVDSTRPAASRSRTDRPVVDVAA
ncbi:MAG: helix-turn-helix domain-containing protein [Actinomycetes bacterium]